MPVDEFGGDWTAEKLERVRKYLAAYTVIFARNPKAQKLIPIYVDAFAGTGYRTKPPRLDAQTTLFEELAEPEAEAFLKGSARQVAKRPVLATARSTMSPIDALS